MKNPDSTWQQLPTILAGLNHNCCGVWSLDRLWGWLETKKLKSSPAVQQETPCWKCHGPIVHNRISHRWPRNSSSPFSLQKILPFPRSWEAASSHLTWHLWRKSMYLQAFPLLRITSSCENRKLAVTHCPLPPSKTYTITLGKEKKESYFPIVSNAGTFSYLHGFLELDSCLNLLGC